MQQCSSQSERCVPEAQAYAVCHQQEIQCFTELAVCTKVDAGGLWGGYSWLLLATLAHAAHSMAWTMLSEGLLQTCGAMEQSSRAHRPASQHVLMLVETAVKCCARESVHAESASMPFDLQQGTCTAGQLCDGAANGTLYLGSSDFP